ncbi:MAG: DUF4177 domain-containing protein [Proteobacteria bacterium]|nr:DUF4177 domain-containing protein [Pseudomonadota bacterium]MBU1546745.1 DUF4177 domain-containing protein [Pseudomonadota bacterium]MBU2619366.1 DUF4177 domain-containing protein [Pseudomonadota bacterium]
MNTAFRFLLTIILAVTLAGSSVLTAEAAAKFDYKAVDLKKVMTPQQLEVILNQLGAEGWELVEINGAGLAILKRQK